ncbi:Cas1p-domain-containing protein [Lindgomyces ingoldianus]|uniref:Cas1p-domain-containing protein n=1 Tax=Lindgomyces ingoldianus TaxID=673940 RepID=A0ACB6QSG6_9PLEO|nr:Cas1p-domain-containing protein [Lindgomyces ingoldianus]KAF2469876.1 Cas1p-domain-containing protein [Lindgomyces ingoldianus]
MPRFKLSRPASLADAFNRVSLILTLAVVTATLYRHHLHNAADPYKCDALINHGQWLDSPDREPEHKPFTSWQPPGCMLHEYTAEEVASCNDGGKILFVGDTGTRQVFWAAARKLDKNWVFKEQAQLNTHGDIEYCKASACLKFLWDPWLNTSALHDELRVFRARQDPEATSAPKSVPGLNMGTRRSVAILIGGGLWHARHIQIGSLRFFQDSVNNITASAYSPGTMASIRNIPISGKEGIHDQIFFAAVLEPQYEKLSPSRQLTIIPEKINEMNDYLEQLSLHQGLNVLWSYADMTRGIPETYGESGLHVIENVAGRMAEVLLNLRCNAKAAYQDGYPFDRTCCSNYRPTNWIQLLGILFALVILPIIAIKAERGMSSATSRVRFDKIVRQRSSSLSVNVTASIPLAFLTLLLAVCFCFLTDRTQIFDKVRKQYTVLDFRYLITLAVVSCLLTIRGSPSSLGRRRSDSFPGLEVQQAFLPRSQSEEFKGWMQMYVLIYGYTGASGELDFYQVLRVFLALYLFLSGYGHTMYFLQKRDYSLQRLVTVLLRMNTLAVFLSFMMARPYTSYYFPPLVSFWFVVVYATLRIANSRNESLPFIIGKVITSALFTSVFIHLKGILELISFGLDIACRANLNVDEWRFQLGTDKYIVYVGMLAAIFYIRISTILNTPYPRQSTFGQTLTRSFPLIRFLALFLSIITIPIFWILTRRSHDKADYNWWMPTISWLPVLSFVVLRNATRFLRNYYCAAFSWLGRISLETYLLSQHIWMAGDGHGILRSGLFKGDGTIKNDRWRDLALLTPIYIWLAWRVYAATATITAWVMMAGEEGLRPQDAAKATHVRAGSALAFLGYDNALPSPNTQGDMKAGMEKKTGKYDTPPDLRRRLVPIGVVLWIANLLYI